MDITRLEMDALHGSASRGPLTKRGIKAEGRRASKGRTHGPAIWLHPAHSLSFARIWPP
jgi:hypothetical protein